MKDEPQISTDAQSSLSSWIETTLFVMNLLLGAIGSVLVYRYRIIAWKVFEDFDVDIPSATQFALSPFYVCILPMLAAVGLAIHFLPLRVKQKVVAQIVNFLLIIVVAGFFVATTVPVMHRLIESL